MKSFTGGARRIGGRAVEAFAARDLPALQVTRRRLLQVAGLGAVGLKLAGIGPNSKPADAVPLDGGDLNHYTGQFHSHTGISSDHPTTRGEPIDAWKNVAKMSDLDFFSVTEHDVTYEVRNADIETEDWRDAVSAEWRLLNEQAEEFNADVASTGLIAVPGTEHTWYDFSGHSNSFNTSWHATAHSGGTHKAAGVWGTGNLMFDLPMYYARLAKDPGAIGQFNHPNPDSGGNFFDFTHLTPEADSAMHTIEVRADDTFRREYTIALDAGWHIAPVYGDDEHHDQWGEDPAVTGIWAAEQTEEALYEAMRNRTVYTSKDVNAQLLVRGNGEMMGAILAGDTTELELRIEAMDPDPDDSFDKVIVHTNGGKEVHTEEGLGRRVDLTVTLEVADGDYYWVEVLQADGDMIVSSPIWIGERVSGANYAPEITLSGRMPEKAAHGQAIPLPSVRAHDDSGKRPTVETTIYTGAGEVAHDGKSFKVSGYDDHYVVVRATDDQGSTAAKYYRIQVNQDKLDPDAVYRHFAPTVNVGAGAGEVGVSVSTDVAIKQAHLQYLPASSDNWGGAQTVSTAHDAVFEVVREGRDGEEYIDRVGGHPLRSHDLDLTGLEPGETYQYRLGVSESGPWTDVRGTFTAPTAENAPLYVLGDLVVDSGEESDYKLFTDMLGVLREKDDRGAVLVQTGDLIGAGGRAEWWDELAEHVLGGLDLPLAAMVGDGETGIFDEADGDKEFNDMSSERNAIFLGMYNHPKNGSKVGASNYSFDQGDVHVAVLNGRYDLTTQMEWLVEDMRATDAKWRVVTGHFSYYGGAHSTDHGMTSGRALVTDTLEQLGVHLYLGGHDRLYKRTTIVDGKVAETPEQVAQGTTFVTVGSAGPKFDENKEFWWDDVVHDEDVQTGVIVDVTDEGLQVRAYDSQGASIDQLTITTSQSDEVRLSSADVVDAELAVGLIGYAKSPEEVVVRAETKDAAGKTVESRTQDVTLVRDGGEQAVTFDSPLPVEREHDVVVEVTDTEGEVLVEAVTVQEGFTGTGTEKDPYVIHSWQQMEFIAEDLDAHYLLAADLDLHEIPRQAIGAAWVVQPDANGTTRGPGAFTGTFDGGGHTISGFFALGDMGGGRYAHGAGLFDQNAGTIRNLGLADAVAQKGVRIGGLLADENSGTIERCWSSGSIEGSARVGGLVGESTGVVRDCYSTATVVSETNVSGGVLAMGLAGSTTERIYGTGAVNSTTNNAGGLLGYAYGGTVARDSIALNPSVKAVVRYAHAVVGRYADGTPTLTGNYAREDMEVAVENYTDEPAPDNPRGGQVSLAQTKSQKFYVDTLGWDFDQTWEWNDELDRPTLQAVPEK